MSKDNFKAFGYEEVKKHQEKYKEETEKRYERAMHIEKAKEKLLNILKMIGRI